MPSDGVFWFVKLKYLNIKDAIAKYSERCNTTKEFSIDFYVK